MLLVRLYLFLVALMLAVRPSGRAGVGAGGGPAAASRDSGPALAGRAEAAQNPAGGGGQPPAAPPAAATICGQSVAAPGESASRRVGAGAVGDGALLRGPGQRLPRRHPDLPVLHPAQGQTEQPVARRLGALRRKHRADRPRRLSAALGDRLPRRHQDRIPRLHVLERRRRQARDLQPRGTAADPDDRLRRVEAGREDED